jgi:PAS domain S-box-containing protein
MGPLSIAQYMIAAVFLTVALLHLLVWSRRPAATTHLLFALAALAAGGNTMATAWFYGSETVPAFNTAFRRANTFGILWAMAILWFVIIYTEADRFTYGFLTVALVMSYDLAGEAVRAAVLSEQVAANERRWRTLLEHVHLLVVGVNRQGCIDYMNPFVGEVSEFDTTDLLGQPISVLVPDDARDWGLYARKTTALPKRPSWIETSLRTKTGGRRLVIWSDVGLHDQGGQVNGLLSIGADITEQRHAESARDRAIEELETAMGEVEALKTRLEDRAVALCPAPRRVVATQPALPPAHPTLKPRPHQRPRAPQTSVLAAVPQLESHHQRGMARGHRRRPVRDLSRLL